MSTFEVKVRTITHLINHPNADRLELVGIGGYLSVVQKGLHTLGDMIVYVPEDSVFTDLSIPADLGIDTYLTGKDKNRVKSMRLRGCLSQGIVLPWRVVGEVLEKHKRIPPLENFYEGLNLTEKLGIIKYEEPIPIEMAGEARPWPTFVRKYDIENIKRPESLEAIKMVDVGQDVVLTEKLHGTNIAVAIGEGLEEGESAFVCSRGYALKESETNVYWRAVKENDLIEKIKSLVSTFDLPNGGQNISLHGEVIGVQDLKYGFSGGKVGFQAFDIAINGHFAPYDTFVKMCDHVGIPRVPELYRGPYDYDKLNAAAHGQSTVEPTHIREGGVMRFVNDITVVGIGRVCFKFISDDYLTRKGGTEHH